MVSSKPRKPPRFGAEVWDQRFGQEWSLWDLWYCVVIELDYDGDPGGLRDALVESIRSSSGGLSGRDSEAKLSHFDDLFSRLAAVDRRPSDLADREQLEAKQVVKRARDKVSDRIPLEWRAQTEAMINTPRHRFEQQARFGWDAFPSDPAQFYERLRPIADRKSIVDECQSFRVAERLEKRLADLDGPRRTLVDRLSLYRAFHTAGLVLADRTDDSYGEVGWARTSVWKTYLSLDWRATAVEPVAYWSDICRLLIWEPYAIDYREETAWFSQVRADEIELVAGILRTSEADLRAAILDWEADRALAAVAHLYLATDHVGGFVEAAQALGSRSWVPIVAMAKHALEAGDRRTAAAVFDAADQPGFHRAFLAKWRKRLRSLRVDLLKTRGPDLGR